MSFITIIICVLLVAAIGYALVKGIWSASGGIAAVLKIVLFVVLLVCVIRLFCTKENAQKLYKGVEETGISQNVESTMRTALNLKPGETSTPEASPAPKAETAQGSEIVNAEEVKETPVSQPVVAPGPVPAKAAPDYSHLDKGKKTFSYALPFNAKVTVGFKDNTYRVISESLGRLDESEKKEIGNLILTSLGKYVGKTIERPDKSKISIESRYDEADNRTRVFAIIPPDAID